MCETLETLKRNKGTGNFTVIPAQALFGILICLLAGVELFIHLKVVALNRQLKSVTPSHILANQIRETEKTSIMSNRAYGTTQHFKYSLFCVHIAHLSSKTSYLCVFDCHLQKQ